MRPGTIARRAVEKYGAIQKVGELASLLALLAENPPKTVVEIGCDAGGTLWAWKQIGAQRVIGVNKPDGGYASGSQLDRHGAEVVAGDSHDVDTLDALTTLLDGDKIDFLFIDGDHTFDGVKLDFVMYAALVGLNGIIGFHDICHHTRPGHEDVGVDRLWDALGGDKEEMITDDNTWGGIGVVRLPRALEGVAL